MPFSGPKMKKEKSKRDPTLKNVFSVVAIYELYLDSEPFLVSLMKVEKFR